MAIINSTIGSKLWNIIFVRTRIANKLIMMVWFSILKSRLITNKSHIFSFLNMPYIKQLLVFFYSFPDMLVLCKCMLCHYCSKLWQLLSRIFSFVFCILTKYVDKMVLKPNQQQEMITLTSIILKVKAWDWSLNCRSK